MMKARLSLLAVGALLAIGAGSYQLHATLVAQPVVRQQFLRQLDPDVFDLEIGTLPFPNGWEQPEHDDSDWCDARTYGDAAGINVPGATMIWSADRSAHQRVGTRRTFNAAAAGSASLLISVVREFSVYLNGDLVFEEFDGSCCSARIVDLTDMILAGENVLAIDGTSSLGSGGIAYQLTGDFGSLSSDGEEKVYVFQGRLPFEGSRWAVFNVPGITKTSGVTVELNKLSTDNCWSLYPEFQNARELTLTLSSVDNNPPTGAPIMKPHRILVRPNQVLVQLTSGIGEGRQPVLDAGLYRIVVDTIQP